MLEVADIELSLYTDRQNPGRVIELLRYQPETDSFVIRVYYESADGMEPLCSGHSLFRTEFSKRFEAGLLVPEQRASRLNHPNC